MNVFLSHVSWGLGNLSSAPQFSLHSHPLSPLLTYHFHGENKTSKKLRYIMFRHSLPYCFFFMMGCAVINTLGFVWITRKAPYDKCKHVWFKICSPAWFVWQEEFPWRKDQFFPHQKVLLLARISKVNFLSKEDQRNHFRILTYLRMQGLYLEDCKDASTSNCCCSRNVKELEDQRERDAGCHCIPFWSMYLCYLV